MILIWLLVLCLVFGGGLTWLVQEFPLPAPFGNITLVALTLVFVIVILSLVLADLAAPR
jgi:hypothetical protein